MRGYWFPSSHLQMRSGNCSLPFTGIWDSKCLWQIPCTLIKVLHFLHKRNNWWSIIINLPCSINKAIQWKMWKSKLKPWIISHHLPLFLVMSDIWSSSISAPLDLDRVGGDFHRLRLCMGFHLFIFTYFLQLYHWHSLPLSRRLDQGYSLFTMSRIGMSEGSMKTVNLTASQDRKAGFYQCNMGLGGEWETDFLELFKLLLKTKIPPRSLSSLRSKWVKEEQIMKNKILDVFV